MKLDSLRFAPLVFVLFGGVFASCSTPTAVIAACDDPGPVQVRGKDTGFEFCTGGTIHRSKIQACPRVEPPAGQCHLVPSRPDSCETNADCAQEGPGSVCVTPNTPDPCSCMFACVTDSDCSEGYLCRCEARVAFCERALCRSDADCGEGRLCMLSAFNVCGGPGLLGFACQSELDECLTSLDCPGQHECVYENDHRTCATKFCGE